MKKNAKEPSIDFVKSIPKFKRKTIKRNNETKIKLLEDFNNTRINLENGQYEEILKSKEDTVEKEYKEQIIHRVERFKIFMENVLPEIKIEESLYKSILKDNNLFLKYFIKYMRYNKIPKSIDDNFKVEKIEIDIAKFIFENFYIGEPKKTDKILIFSPKKIKFKGVI